MAELVELATIWLVDLVGSTRLATSVGPARADELRAEFFACCAKRSMRRAARSSRTRAMVVRGVLVGVGGGEVCGVDAAVVRAALSRRGAAVARTDRVGTGESTVKDGDYFGMPSIEAARLCDKAPADGILVSPMTKMAAGRVDGARFESVGELELKGIPEPVEAFTVVWEPLEPEQADAGVGRWPLPEALRGVPRIAYVGRAAGAWTLEQARAAARSGARQLVLLSGEPGIGKTRLASYSALGANADGFGVCWGACSEDLAVPYEPWIAVCSQLVEHAPEAVLNEYAERFGGEVGRLARNLGRRRCGRAGAAVLGSGDGAVPAVPGGRGAAAGGRRRRPRCWWCWTISIGRTRSRWRC